MCSWMENNDYSILQCSPSPKDRGDAMNGYRLQPIGNQAEQMVDKHTKLPLPVYGIRLHSQNYPPPRPADTDAASQTASPLSYCINFLVRLKY